MSNRFIPDDDGLRWDRIQALDLEGHTEQRPKPTISITGIVTGSDGALLLRLPGVLTRYFALQPGEAQAMRDALADRVQDDPAQHETSAD